MRWLVRVGFVLGTINALLLALFFVGATLVWLVRHWHPAPWVVGVVGLALMAAAVALIWRWWCLPVERRFRFSMRGMLIGVTSLALWLGIVGTDLLRWGREAAAVMELAGCGVEVNQELSADQDWAGTRRLARVFGYNPFLEVKDVDIRSDEGLPALLEHRNDLPDLEYVNFWGGSITDAGLDGIEKLDGFPNLHAGLISGCRITDSSLERLADWRRLEELHLHNCANMTDAGLAHLSKLPNLRFLRLLQENAGTMPVTDAGLAQVAGLPHLRELMIVRIPVTDAGLAHVGNLHQLKAIFLVGISVTDEGIAQLQGLKNIEAIHLRNTKVTKAGVNALCEALPDCLVTWDEAKFPAVFQIRRIEVWDEDPEEMLLATITDVDRIAKIKKWLEENHTRLHDNLIRKKMDWMYPQDGPSGACVGVRFKGRSRQLSEIHLGNGVYETRWGFYCPMQPADEEQIRQLLGVDEAEWKIR